MTRITTLVIAAIAVLCTLVGSASADQGRRLAGPFCINLHTGVVRTIAATKHCQRNEIRKLGVALHTQTLTNAVPTTTGPAGAHGIDGANGTNGRDGKDGVAGPKGDAGATGTAGPKGDKGDAGPAGPKGDPGSNGSTGPAGPVGATGPAGPTGSAGPAGTNGLGSGTATLCVSNGGNVKYGGLNGEFCDNGHDLIVRVVIAGPIGGGDNN